MALAVNEEAMTARAEWQPLPETHSSSRKTLELQRSGLFCVS